MKKRSNYLTVVLMILMLVGICGTGVSAVEKYEIAVLLPGPTGYFVATKSGITKAIDEFDVNVVYSDAQWDPAKQMSQAEDFIQKDVDMLALIAVDSEAAKSIVRLANKANIPVMALVNTVGTDPTGKYEGLVTYVGQSDLDTGKLSGKMAVDLVNENGKVVMIEGAPGTSAQRMRKKGFMSIVDKYDNVEVVYSQTSNWEKEKAMKIMEDLVQRNLDFDLVYCQDDNSAIGAGMILRDYNMKDDVFVIGTDGSKQGLEAIKRGIIDRTSWKSAIDESYSAIKAAVQLLNGEEIPSVIQKNQVEVNVDNVEEFNGEW